VEKSVVVVHGVGDPLPGNALEKLIEGLTAAEWRVEKPLRIEHREETLEEHVTTAPKSEEEKQRELKQPRLSFPVARASLTKGTDTLNLREVYWGDLSRPKGSLFGLVSALFDLIFGLRYIVSAATNQMKGRTVALWGGQFARASLWWARGPMFALNIVAAAICLAYLAISSLQWSCLSGSAPLLGVLAGGLSCAALGWYVMRRAAKLQWSPSTGKAMIAAGLVTAAGGCLMRANLESDLDVFIGDAGGWTGLLTVTGVMVVFAVVMVSLALASLVLCAVAWTIGKLKKRAPDNGGPLVVVSFCMSLALGLFTFVVVAIWVLIARTIREDAADRIDRCLRGMPDHLLQKCLESEVWQTEGTKLATRVEAGIHLLPLLVIGFGVIAVCFAGVMWVNTLKRKSDRADRLRYIVHPSVVAAAVSFTAVYAVLFLWLAWSIMTGDGKFPEWAKVDALKPVALVFTAGVVALVVAQQSKFLTALDLLLDVIAHFRTEDEKRGGTGDKHYVWNRIIARFKTVVDDELKKPNTPIVVVGHSQGTSIAAQGLGALTNVYEPRIHPAAGVKRVRLVTMGSPIRHLYRHYMSTRYETAKDVVTDWLNIYRLDDYIGTKIVEADKSTGVVLFGAGVRDTHIGEGGHTDYWSDSRAIKHIVDAINRAQL
jgi:hypothetical protein